MLSPPYSFFEIDIETLSTRKTAAIIQIAAVYVPASTEFESTEQFMNSIKRFTHIVKPDDGHISLDTIVWINEACARRELLADAYTSGHNLQEVLKLLIDFKVLNHLYGPCFCQGAAFDWPILENAAERCGLEEAWDSAFPFYNQYCSRTIQNVIPLMSGAPICIWDTAVPRETFGRHHDALSDCFYQAYKHCLLYEKFGIELNRLFSQCYAGGIGAEGPEETQARSETAEQRDIPADTARTQGAGEASGRGETPGN